MLIPSWKNCFTLLFLALALAGCGEAPRDNPLDPLSPKPDEGGTLLVRAQSFYPPYSPLSNVALTLSPGNFFLSTNAEGSAEFSNLVPGQYLITANKSGYVADSVRIEVRARQTSQHTFPLNAIPRFANAVVYSEHISRWFPINRDIFRMVVTTQVLDADGTQDLRTVKLLSQTHGELDTLTFRAETGRYELILNDTRLPGKSLYDFVGEPLRLEVRDRAAAAAFSTPLVLTRIVEMTPVAESPASFTATGVRPRFEWKELTLPYHYTYRVDISQFLPDQQFATLFESVNNIHADSSAYTMQRDLPDGTYYWTVSIVDRQGNASRSKEATFQVE